MIYITADDIGILESIDRAVEKLINKGIINNISIFINSDLDYEWIKKYSNKLSLSLHLTFSYGKPISEKSLVPDLVDDMGYFKRPIKPLIGTSEEIDKSVQEYLLYLEEVPEEQLERECIAQFEHFCQMFGKKPDFVNVHHDLDKSSKICRIIKKCLPVFKTRQMLLQEENNWQCFYEFFSENSTFQQSFDKISNIIKLANRLNQEKNISVELIFHPAYFTEELKEFSSYARAREMEYKVLMQIIN